MRKNSACLAIFCALALPASIALLAHTAAVLAPTEETSSERLFAMSAESAGVFSEQDPASPEDLPTPAKFIGETDPY